MDEIHSAKNDASLRSKAAHAMARPIVKYSTTSKVILLSATPMDKQEHAISLLKDMGMLDEEACIFEQGTGIVSLSGYNELLEYCEKYNKTITSSLSTPTRKSELYANCYTLMKSVILPLVNSEMDEPELAIPPTLLTSPEMVRERDEALGFYIPEKSDEELISEGNAKLRKAIHTKEEDGNDKVDWEAVQTALMDIEMGKVGIAARLAESVLSDADDTSKVVIGCFFTETIHVLEKRLKKYHPLVLNGEMTQSSRPAIIDMFQNDARERCIIVNPAVGGVGIDLDDKIGNQRRYLLLFPSYRYIDMVQMIGRVRRAGTASCPVVRLIFSATEKGESNVMRNLNKKSEIVSGFGDKEKASVKIGMFLKKLEVALFEFTEFTEEIVEELKPKKKEKKTKKETKKKKDAERDFDEELDKLSREELLKLIAKTELEIKKKEKEKEKDKHDETCSSTKATTMKAGICKIEKDKMDGVKKIEKLKK